MLFGADVALAVLTGMVAAGGVLLLVMALRGMPARTNAPDGRRDPAATMRSLGTRGIATVAAGLVTLVLTRWVAVAVGIGALAFFWSEIAGGAAEERKAITQLEGLAAWTESLRDTIAGAVGLEQAIPASLRAAAPALQGPLRALVDRMHTRVPLADALQYFADDINDPSGDLIVGALVLNARLRGPGLREMLGALADSARAELDMRRRVEADRKATRRSVRVVVVFSVGIALLLALFNRAYVKPYGTFLGQLVLVVIVGFYAAAFYWLRRLSQYELPQRFMRTRTESSAADATVEAPLRSSAVMDAGGGR